MENLKLPSVIATDKLSIPLNIDSSVLDYSPAVIKSVLHPDTHPEQTIAQLEEELRMLDDLAQILDQQCRRLEAEDTMLLERYRQLQRKIFELRGHDTIPVEDLESEDTEPNALDITYALSAPLDK